MIQKWGKGNRLHVGQIRWSSRSIIGCVVHLSSFYVAGDAFNNVIGFDGQDCSYYRVNSTLDPRLVVDVWLKIDRNLEDAPLAQILPNEANGTWLSASTTTRRPIAQSVGNKNKWIDYKELSTLSVKRAHETTSFYRKQNLRDKTGPFAKRSKKRIRKGKHRINALCDCSNLDLDDDKDYFVIAFQSKEGRVQLPMILYRIYSKSFKKVPISINKVIKSMLVDHTSCGIITLVSFVGGVNRVVLACLNSKNKRRLILETSSNEIAADTRNSILFRIEEGILPGVFTIVASNYNERNSLDGLADSLWKLKNYRRGSWISLKVDEYQQVVYWKINDMIRYCAYKILRSRSVTGGRCNHVYVEKKFTFLSIDLQFSDVRYIYMWERGLTPDLTSMVVESDVKQKWNLANQCWSVVSRGEQVYASIYGSFGVLSMDIHKDSSVLLRYKRKIDRKFNHVKFYD